MHEKLKIVVTGGSGFIGSNVCLRLLNKGHEVICLDNLSTGCKHNMMEFLFNPLFHFIVHDITTPFSISGIDLVIHCATPDLRDPLHFLKTCSYGAFTAAGMARRNEAKLICLSSCKVYGDKSSNMTEDMNNIINPDTLSSGINMLESILRNYSSLDIKILRLYDVYGPKMNKTSFIYENLRKINRGEDITFDFHPSSKICSCYIDDVVDAICCSMEMRDTEDILNIGSASDITVDDFFNLAVISSESKSEIKFNWKDEKDITLIGDYADNRKAIESLRWKQKISYKIGIKKVLDFIKLGPDRDYEKGEKNERAGISFNKQ